VVASFGFAALALMNAVEPWVFPDRRWDTGRGITVAGVVGGACAFAWLARVVRDKP
jgi:hypothetical protein